MDKDAFESAKTWIKHAREDIALFIASQSEAIKTAKFVASDYIEGGRKFWVVRPTNPPADTLKTRVASALNALRSALDQATYAAAMQLGGEDSDCIYFPFAGTKLAFENLFKENGRVGKHIPKELHPYLEKLSGFPTDPSYEGGNTLLYAISRITNPNKHKTTYRVSVQFSGEIYVDHFGCDGLCHKHTIPPRWDPEKEELQIAITEPSAKVSYNYQMSPQIAFGKTPFVTSAPVVAILDKLICICDGIVLGLEAETARILKERSGQE